MTHEIIKALNCIPGVRVWRQNTGRRGRVSYGLKGSGDITGVIRGGRRVELEVKLPHNDNFEPEQLGFHRLMIEHGAVCGVVRSISEAIDLVMKELQ